MRRYSKLWIAIATVAAVACVLPASSLGAVQIGQASPMVPAGAVTPILGQPTSYVQATNVGSPSYAVPFNGVIVSWASRNPNPPPSPATDGRLKVFRSLGGSAWFTVGQSKNQLFNANTLQTYPTRIGVKAGDRLGFTIPQPSLPVGGLMAYSNGAAAGDTIAPFDDEPPPGSTVNSGVAMASRFLNVQATLEADADRDEWGDETQDRCPGVYGNFLGCPDPSATSDKTAPVITGAKADPKKIQESSSVRAASARASKLKSSLDFVFTVSEPATTDVEIQIKTKGRKVGKKCKAKTKKNRGKKKCKLYKSVGTFEAGGATGENRAHLSARILDASLKRGSYRGVLEALDSEGNRSKKVNVSFKVVKK